MHSVPPRNGVLTRASVLLVGAATAFTLIGCTSPSHDSTSSPAAAAADATPVAGRGAGRQVEFPNGGITMAGNVFVPADFDPARSYPTIVVVHPGGGVKEQTAGVYAQRLADQGFLTLAFDASYQGASGGTPRFLDNPMNRVGDIYSAVDYLTTLPYVAEDNIGILGICAGGGATIKAATTDRRIKAVATVSGVDVGAATRRGWEGNASEADQIATLNAVAAQRSAEAAGAEPVYVPYVPAVGDQSAPRDLQEAADYYLTDRGRHPNAPNKMLQTSASYMVSFTGFDRIDTLLTQPLLVVAGSEAGSLWHSRELHDRAASTQKELAIIDGATHMDLYDGPGVDQSMARLSPFYTNTLK
ncbi:alpha/beta hydrolase [Nocardia salmonicida]|uniref:alpha/beta hydrolase n=1 Tax=Nocardia salmonicida TaxID=53431 RepID=UPI003403062E